MPVLAYDRSVPDLDGYVEVVVSFSDGSDEVVSGDWVATQPSLSPAGDALVVVRADGDYESSGPGSTTLWIVDLDGAAPRQLTTGPFDDEPAWSADGSTIVFSQLVDDGEGRRSRLATVPAAGGEVTPITTGDDGRDGAPVWSPDGEQVAFIREPPGAGDGPRPTTVWVTRADGSEPRQLSAVGDAHSLDWHPKDPRLMVSTFAAEDGSVSTVDLDTGALDEVARGATMAAWADDGDDVVYFTHEGAQPASWWRLVRGRIEGEGLSVADDLGHHGYLYPQFGLDVGPCG